MIRSAAVIGITLLVGSLALFITFRRLKNHEGNRREIRMWLVLWVVLVASVLLAQPAVDFLIRNELTDSPRLSLFDVLLITWTVISLFMIYRLYLKIDRLEQRLSDLNSAASIRFTELHSSLREARQDALD
jgi:hypothetical protein